MQYCEIFDQIKASLEDYDGNVKILDDVAFRNGNERVVQDVARRIKDIMLEHHLMLEGDPGNADSDNHNCNNNENLNRELSLCSSEKRNELRKVFVFLLLNTNIKYKHDLGELNNHICHILRICPLLPRFVFVEVVWACALDAHFYELLTYAPPWLTYQHFGDAAASLHYIKDPCEVLKRIQHIVCAAMRAISLAGGAANGGSASSAAGSAGNDDGGGGDVGLAGHGSGSSNGGHSVDTVLAKSCDTKQLFHVKLYSCVTKLMLHFDPGKGLAAKFKKKKRQLKRFKGYAMRHLLEMCLEGLKLLEAPLTTVPLECAMYAMYSGGARPGRSKRKQQDAAAAPPECVYKQLLLKVINNLLNTLHTCIMTVEVDAYVYWSEVDAINVRDCTNLQEHVGALSFELLERLSAAKPQPIKHIVCEVLKQFAAKPVNFETRMELSTLGELLHLLDVAKLPKEQQLICMNVLFKRFSIIYGNDECLDTIANRAHLLNVGHCTQIMQYIKIDLSHRELLNMDTSNDYADYFNEVDVTEKYETLIGILQKAFLALPAMAKLQILIAREQELGASIGSHVINFQMPNYRQRSNTYWNTFVRRTFEPNKFLNLCFENSADIWQRFFRASLDNDQMVAPYLTACNATRAYARSYQQASMLAALGCEVQIQSANFSDLFFALYFHNYRDHERSSMLKHILYKIHRHLKAARYEALYVLIRLLEQLSAHDRKRHMKRFAFGTLTSHVILTVANVMNQTRWNMHNFCLERARLVAVCRIFMESNVEQYARKVHPIARKVLLQKVTVCSFSRFTAYYMQGLASPKTRNYAQFVMPRINQDLSDITHYAKLMLCCTEGEIYQVANNLHFRQHLFVIMSTISQIVSSSNRPELLDNYTYLFDAFVVIIGRSLNILECSAAYYLALFERICELIMTPPQLHPRLLAASAELFEKFARLPNGKKTVLRRLRQMPMSIEKQLVMKQIIAIKNR